MPSKVEIRRGMLWGIAKLVYRLIFRRYIIEAIEDPEDDWDDKLLITLDTLFTM